MTTNDQLGLTADQVVANAAANLRRIYPSADRAAANLAAEIPRICPSADQLCAAGTDAHVARLQGEFDRALSTTRRGRLVLWWSRWRARSSTG